MNLEDAFSQLLGRSPTNKERERLDRVRVTLKIRDNDALWSILVALEYYNTLYQEYPQKIAAELKAAVGAAPNALLSSAARPARSVPTERAPSGRVSLSLTVWLSLVLVYQVLFGSVCLWAGLAANSDHAPFWIDRHADFAGPTKLLVTLLAAPAGWMAFAFALPMALAGTRLGYEMTRSGSPASGWVVVLVCVAAVIASALALGHLL